MARSDLPIHLSFVLNHTQLRSESGNQVNGTAKFSLEHKCTYFEFLLIAQHRISKVSEQRTTAQIAAAYERFARIAVTRAEMPQAIAIKNQKPALILGRNFRSWWPLSSSTPEASNCPATDCQLAPISAIYMAIWYILALEFLYCET